jgi:hypothetical protein
MGGITSLKRHLHNAIADNLVIPAGSRHLCGAKEPVVGRSEVILLCVLRDGAEYIQAFMEHYQKLGVAHMVFLDNGSRDNTVELLSGYDNVTVYQTHLPYKHYFRNFKRFLAKRFASDRWFLCVDIDEFFEYPHQDRLPLNQLVSYLDKRGFNAVRSVMLDMFSDEPIHEDEGQSRAFSRQRYAYFESASIEKKFFPAVRARKKRSRRNIEPRDDLYIAIGGVRKRCFGTECCLTKHPLQFMAPGKLLIRSDHDVQRAHIADFTGALFHYKFTPSFFAQCDQSVREENHWNGSSEYKRYKRVLDQNKRLYLYSDSAVRYSTHEQLLDKKLMLVSDDYLNELEEA